MEVDPPSITNEKASHPQKARRKVRGRQKKKTPVDVSKIQRFEFAELNIRHSGDAANTLEMVKRAVRMGYDTVVINIDVGDLTVTEDVQDPPKKKKKKGKVDDEPAQKFHSIPDPFEIDESKLDLSQLEANGKKFRQFSRLTVTLTTDTSIHKLQHHPKRPLYDIVAVRCLDEAMLSTMSRKGELFDLITLDGKEQDGRFQWIHKQKLIQACIEEGISFELCYSDALTDTTFRRQMLTNGRQLYRTSRKGKGLILSSGAQNGISLRSPYDTANLAVLFGAKPNDGKRLVSENCCRLLLRSQARRTVKGAFHVADLDTAPVPPFETNQSLKMALEAIPEFKEQMTV